MDPKYPPDDRNDLTDYDPDLNEYSWPDPESYSPSDDDEVQRP